MSKQDTAPQTLFELLARTWTTGASISSMIFNADQSAIAYCLGDAAVAIAPVADNDPIEQRVHVNAEDGRTAIRPRTAPARPLISVDVETDAPLLLGQLGTADFITGAPGGPFYRVSAEGEKTDLGIAVEAPVTATDYCSISQCLAIAGGSTVTLLEGGELATGLTIEQVGAISAIKCAPAGDSIAVAHENGLTIWSMQTKGRKLADFVFPGKPGTPSWSPDGRWLAVPLADGGFQLIDVRGGNTNALTDYPEPVNAIDWNTKVDALVTSGAYRVAAWSMDQAPLEDRSSGALESGTTGLVPVSAVTSHPDRNLVAAGYKNGLVVVMQLGARDELVLNSEDRGAITNLAWTLDGRHLVLATSNDVAAIISIPEQLFK
ncbi:WD40 repeat domain-containing protein [Anderseniella sp. Alg231-50]|uniref:WD40 repeat domain-containing protein n=1 Tax=Anderseniella sp. Alg231-50 TaxID=1922226 RepID=UPI000D55280D